MASLIAASPINPRIASRLFTYRPGVLLGVKKAIQLETMRGYASPSAMAAECNANPLDDVPTFPFARPHGTKPSAEFARLLANNPVSRVRLWDGSQPWLIVKNEDVRKVLTDPRLSKVGRRLRVQEQPMKPL